MTKVAILYGTSEGQTARISEHVARAMRDLGHEAETVDVKEEPGGLDDYDGLVVGSSVHMGKHEERVRDFVVENRDLLERVPSAFFSVSMTARDHTEEARAKTEEYVERFVEETGWRPDMVGVFAGALRYSQYGFIKRHIMKKISRDMGNPDTDASRDYEYTDWDDVGHFAEDFLDGLAQDGHREPKGAT